MLLTGQTHQIEELFLVTGESLLIVERVVHVFEAMLLAETDP